MTVWKRMQPALAAFSLFLLIANSGKCRAGGPAAMPQIYGGTIRLVFLHGVPSGSTATVSAGPIHESTAINPPVAGGGLSLWPLPLSASQITETLEAGQPIDISVVGPRFTGKWQILPVIDYTANNAPIPPNFTGGVDTNSTGSVVQTAQGAHAQLSFTAQKHNYVMFSVTHALPTDTVAVGGILSDDPASPQKALLTLRIQDSRGEIFGYSGHGDDRDIELPVSSALNQYRYRYAGPPVPIGQTAADSPTAPATLIGLLLEPATWQWSGSMSTNIACVYAVRQIEYCGPAFMPKLTVELDQAVPNHKNMSGFLHGIDLSHPGQDILNSLHPALWRIGARWLDDRDRLKALDVPLVFVFSDIWGYITAPSADWNRFDTFVHQTIEDEAPYNGIWDTWNEPDHTMTWPGGTYSQCFDIYKHEYSDLHADLGSAARLEGPSYAFYDHQALEQFLDYCLANHLQLDYLSWHELDVDGDIPQVIHDLCEARTDFVDNPKYKSLHIRGIHVNETVGASAQYRPGEIIGYLSALELGGADAACKGCWYDSHGAMNGFNNSLDGIVTPDTGEPRSAYWAYKLYADGQAFRVRSQSSDLNLPVLAGDTPDSAQLLIGNIPVQGFSATTGATITLTGIERSQSLHGAKFVTVTIARLPDSGEAPLAAPLPVSIENVPVKNNAVAIDLPAFAVHEGLAVTLRRE